MLEILRFRGATWRSALLLCFMVVGSSAVDSTSRGRNARGFGRVYPTSALIERRRAARAAGRRVTPPFRIEMKQSNHNAPNDGLDLESGGAISFDEASGNNLVTVAVHSDVLLGRIEVILPARQQCTPDGSTCTGYQFAQATGNCIFKAIPAQELPPDQSVWDLQKEDLVDSCRVDNSYGNGMKSRPKRSHMTMFLKSDPASQLKLQNSFLEFRFLVRNAPRSPTRFDEYGNPANTFQVMLWTQSMELLGTRTFDAGSILSVWMCGYTDFVRTGQCTATCGGGVEYSVRRMLHPPPPKYPKELLKNCDQDLTQTLKCSEGPCDVDCKYGDWTGMADGTCSKSCGWGFEVQRRRVVEGPQGGGQLCKKWDDAERVRYAPCKLTDCPQQRCELAPPSDHDMRLVSPCSSWCGSGTRTALTMATRKDVNAKMDEDCQQKYDTVPCPTLPVCRKLQFFPADPGRLPIAEEWSEIVMVFYLHQDVQYLQLTAPRGFQIGMQKLPDTGSGPPSTPPSGDGGALPDPETLPKCLIREHNLPRLGGCRVWDMPDGNSIAIFQLMNPLEAWFHKKDGTTWQPQYQVRFWAKSPSCVGGYDERLACIVNRGDWDWNLQGWLRKEGVDAKFSETASYKVYSSAAATGSLLEEKHLEVVSMGPKYMFLELLGGSRR